MAINQSKLRDPRFWKKWEESGAVGSMQNAKPLLLSEIPSKGDYTSVTVLLEGRADKGSPKISYEDARFLSEWKEEFTRIDPATAGEVQKFQALEKIGLVNDFKGSYELSGVAQRARYIIS
jgi:hypothetical protein